MPQLRIIHALKIFLDKFFKNIFAVNIQRPHGFRSKLNNAVHFKFDYKTFACRYTISICTVRYILAPELQAFIIAVFGEALSNQNIIEPAMIFEFLLRRKTGKEILIL